MKRQMVQIQVIACELTFYVRKEKSLNIEYLKKRIRTFRPCVDLHDIEIKINEVY